MLQKGTDSGTMTVALSLSLPPRVAIVTIRGSQSAEAAVRELNGCNMQGHTVHVQVLGLTGEGRNQDPDSTSSPKAAQTNVKPSEHEKKV